MLDRVKAKRDAIDKEIDLHQRAIECLKKKLVVYDEIIEEEENRILADTKCSTPVCDNEGVEDSEDEPIAKGITYAEID